MSTPNESGRSSERWQIGLYLAAFTIAILVFQHAIQHHTGGLIALWNSRSPQFFLVLSPAVIFVITTLAYYRFITDYKGEVAGLSIVALLLALYCCEQLLESDPHDWPHHLFWMYCLFYSYVTWDSLMLNYLLPHLDTNTVNINEDREEIVTLSHFINQPTLGTLLVTSFVAAHFIPTDSAGYVNGVVGFHLIFASIACVRNLRVWKTLRLLRRLWSVFGRLCPEPTRTRIREMLN